MFILAIVWICSALFGAVFFTYLLHGAFPFFTILWLIVPLIAVLRLRDVNQIGFSKIGVRDFLSITAITISAQVVITTLFEPWSHTSQRLYVLALASPTPDTTFLWVQHFDGIVGWTGMVFYSAFVTIFAEELFFRGWFLRWLLQHFRPVWAIIIQATAFTVLVNLIVAFFMPPLQAAVYVMVYSWMCIGLVNGWAAKRTGSIWPGLAAAVVGNLVGMLFVIT